MLLFSLRWSVLSEFPASYFFHPLERTQKRQVFFEKKDVVVIVVVDLPAVVGRSRIGESASMVIDLSHLFLRVRSRSRIT